MATKAELAYQYLTQHNKMRDAMRSKSDAERDIRNSTEIMKDLSVKLVASLGGDLRVLISFNDDAVEVVGNRVEVISICNGVGLLPKAQPVNG